MLGGGHGDPVASTPGRVRRTVRAVPRALGVVALLLVLDFGAGYAWDVAWGHNAGSTPAVNEDPIHIAESTDSSKDFKVQPDARADLPSMRDVPWWKDYLRELQLTPGVFYPYLINKPLPFDGHYIHIDDNWARRSYEPPGQPTAEEPTVWFFGGSTTFGEGQRDEHTIPSEVARLAEADGLPVRVVNDGQRGWVNWQEMLLYEQLLSDSPKPDFAVFYDGANDKAVQVQDPIGQPSFFDLDALARKATGNGVERTDQTRTQESSSDALSGLWHDFQRHSLVAKVVSKVQDELGVERADAASPSDPRQACFQDQNGKDCVDVDVVVKDTLAVYRRGRSLILDLSRRHGVSPVLFWQPQPGNPPEYVKLSQLIDAPTVNISNALDGHADTLIDGFHTNEQGAAIVAAAQWKTLKPQIEAWYHDHPGGG